MLRTAAGHVLRDEAPARWSSGVSAPLEKGLSLIKDNPFLTFGGDFRFLGILVTDQDDKKSPLFFPMQGDIYLGSRLGEPSSPSSRSSACSAAATPRCARSSAWSTASPTTPTLKFGKFMPPVRPPARGSHRRTSARSCFVDQSNPVSYGSGVEVGADPLVLLRPLRLPQRGPPARRSNTDDDLDRLLRRPRGWQGLWLQLGGSFLHVNDNRNWGAVSGPRPGRPAATGRRTAAYGSVNLWRLTWLFEYDLVQNDLAGSAGDFDEFISFNELNFLAFRGTTFKVRYETLDPNRDIKDDELTRYAAGLEFHPYTFTELDFQYRYNDTPQEDYGQVLAMVHFWF